MEKDDESNKKKPFSSWIHIYYLQEKKDLTIEDQVKIADKKRIKAVKKENYLKAAKYMDIIKKLTKK